MVIGRKNVKDVEKNFMPTKHLSEELLAEFREKFSGKVRKIPVQIHSELGIPMAESETETIYPLAGNPKVIAWIRTALQIARKEGAREERERIKSMFTKWTNKQFKTFKLDRFALQDFANKLEALKDK